MDRTSNSLIIASVQKGHEGQYWCTATNVVSVVSSKKASLRVITSIQHPFLTVELCSQIQCQLLQRNQPLLSSHSLKQSTMGIP